MTTALLRPKKYSMWVRDLQTDSELVRPDVVVTADVLGISEWPHVRAWLDAVPCIEFHQDSTRGWPFQSRGLGPWRISGIEETAEPFLTSYDGPDRIEATYAAMHALASLEHFPRLAWELAADRTHGLLSVAIATVKGRSLALGHGSSFGLAALTKSRRCGVSLSSRSLPTKGRVLYAD